MLLLDPAHLHILRRRCPVCHRCKAPHPAQSPRDYLDHDISCRKCLYSIHDFAAWFPRALPPGINNDLMGTRAGHPVMRKAVEELEGGDTWLVFPWLTIFWSTGPRFATDMVHEYLVELEERRRGGSMKHARLTDTVACTVDLESISILSASMYCGDLQFL